MQSKRIIVAYKPEQRHRNLERKRDEIFLYKCIKIFKKIIRKPEDNVVNNEAVTVITSAKGEW